MIELIGLLSLFQMPNSVRMNTNRQVINAIHVLRLAENFGTETFLGETGCIL